MIWRFSITVLVTLILLTLKNYYEVKRQKQGIWTGHNIDWWLLAIIEITLTLIIFRVGDSWVLISWYKLKWVIASLIFNTGWGWTYFDLVHNLFAGEKLDYVSPPSVHQSLSDKFLTFVVDEGGSAWQYIFKGAALFLALLIDLIILTV